jgi:carboxypeptidase C (cathepsin A)
VTEPFRCFTRLLQLTIVLALLAAPALSRAEETPAAPEPAAADRSSKPSPSKAALLPPASTTRHTLSRAGEDLDYSAVAGAVALREGNGETAAEIFYVAYTSAPKDSERPVTFVFNGGPGAASAYLHLGAMGPRVVETTALGQLHGPPPRLTDNDATWLDFTDLVFVDPVGAGYSHAVDRQNEHKYWGVEQDAEALADFIRLYLLHAGRMASPVFLMGESYGGFRVATLARTLQKSAGISPSGLVLLSPVLEFALLHGESYVPLSWALSLPSLAAVNLESKGVTGREKLADALARAEHYALSDYLVALASGVEEGGDLASKTVSELTGLPLDVVERRHARISPGFFIKAFDRANTQVLSLYDGSVKGPDPNPASAWAHGPDPVLDATVPLWTSAFVRYAQTELDFKTDAAYRLINREARKKWDFGTSPTRQGYAGVLDDIQEARALNPKLEVMIVGGYTDLITPYLTSIYLVRQLPALPGAAPITIENYPGGHMLYLRPESRRALKQDVEAMYERALGGPSSRG